jgi:hypothetical protein
MATHATLLVLNCYTSRHVWQGCCRSSLHNTLFKHCCSANIHQASMPLPFHISTATNLPLLCSLGKGSSKPGSQDAGNAVGGGLGADGAAAVKHAVSLIIYQKSVRMALSAWHVAESSAAATRGPSCAHSTWPGCCCYCLCAELESAPVLRMLLCTLQALISRNSGGSPRHPSSSSSATHQAGANSQGQQQVGVPSAGSVGGRSESNSTKQQRSGSTGVGPKAGGPDSGSRQAALVAAAAASRHGVLAAVEGARATLANAPRLAAAAAAGGGTGPGSPLKAGGRTPDVPGSGGNSGPSSSTRPGSAVLDPHKAVQAAVGAIGAADADKVCVGQGRERRPV